MLSSKINAHLKRGTACVALIATDVLIVDKGAPTLQTVMSRTNGRSKSSQ
jgi:hypothetical protein